MRWVVLSLTLAGCLPPEPIGWSGEPDDSEVVVDSEVVADSEPVVDSEPAAPVTQGTLVGSWLSEGEDVAPLLAGPPFGVTRVDATFRANGSYLVVSRDGQGNSVEFQGSYSVDTRTNPRGITLSQASPVEAQVAGVWRVNGTTLRYDVVDLSLGTPASPEGGLGSSSAGAANVQIYQRVP